MNAADWMASDAATLWAVGAMALLLLLQILVADLAGVRARHVPGAPVTADHGLFLFRAARVVGNSNESIAVFVLAVLFALARGADPAWTAATAWSYVLSRAVYAVCYWADWRLARSVVFGIGLLALVLLLAGGALA